MCFALLNTRKRGQSPVPLIFFLIRLIRFRRAVTFGFVFAITLPKLLILTQNSERFAEFPSACSRSERSIKVKM
jgi:hypothetical protein